MTREELGARLAAVEASMEEHAAAWLEERAAGRSTAALDARWKEADAERRRLERKLRRLAV